MTTTKPTKPLGGPAYGRIPHLPGSRRGPADRGISDRQALILTLEPRDKHDTIIVTEKLDGSCVSIANFGGEIVPLTRAGYRATYSRFEQHHRFHDWVMAHRSRFDFLADGERLCGEWLAQAHGTRYDLTDRDPFAAFDIMRGKVRSCYDDFLSRIGGRVWAVPMLFRTDAYHRACDIDLADLLLGPHGYYGAIDRAEGAVWRVERKGKVDFLAKWVRPDKVDGRYLPEQSGGEPIWNWPL